MPSDGVRDKGAFEYIGPALLCQKEQSVTVFVCVSDPALLIFSTTASPPLYQPQAVCVRAEPCA